MAALTEAEELELEMEQARARKAQANSDAARSAASSLGLGDTAGGPASKPNETPIVGAGKAFLQGAGEGVVNLLDLPTQAATFVRNAPALTTNAAIAAAKDATPEQLKERGVDPAIVNMQPEATVKSPDYNTTLYNTAVPGDPDWSEARKIGKITGSVLPAIVAPELLAGRLPAVLPTLADTALTTATTYSGGKGGRAIDEALGGSGDKGEFFGSLIGGSTTPLVSNLTSRLTTDANSLVRLKNAQIAGVKKPDLSLVGSDWASRRGNPANQQIQQGQIDQSLLDLSQAIRQNAVRGPVQPPSRPISSADIGKDVSTAADTGFQSAGKDANTIFGPMSEAAGRDTPIDHTIIQAKIDELRNLGVTAKPTLDYYQNLLNSDVSSGGLTWDRALRQRRLTEPSETSLKLDPNIQKQINGAFDDALRKRAGEVGYTPQEFDAINTEYGGLQGDRDTLSEIAGSKGQPAYNEVFSPSNLGGENLNLLRHHNDPQTLAKILADNLELKTRGPAVAGRPELPIDTGLNSGAPDWWAKLPEDARDAYFPPGSPERSKMDATMATMKADARRGGYQTEAPSVATPAAGAALVTGHPLAAATIMAPRAGSALFGKVMQSPRFTEAMIARRANPLTPLDLARTIAAAVGSR